MFKGKEEKLKPVIIDEESHLETLLSSHLYH
jgi:hypothetical protein